MTEANPAEVPAEEVVPNSTFASRAKSNAPASKQVKSADVEDKAVKKASTKAKKKA